MKARPTLFLSGVSHEFGSFRDAVEIQIQMNGCFPENQPSFPPSYDEVERMLTRRIEGADAVICLVGFRYGAEPRQRPEGARRRSYTQMEFDIALSLGKPVYRFLSDETLRPRDPPEPDEGEEDAEAQALQLEHRRNLTATNHLYYFFRDKEELCRQVAEIPLVAQADFKIDASRIVQFGPPRLFGREAHLARLDAAMNDAGTRVLTLVGWGGTGKSSLVAHWMAGLAKENWRGLERVYAWSFYHPGLYEPAEASSEIFIAAALEFFGETELAGSNVPARRKAERLADRIAEHPTLLVLDGLEPLQYPPAPLEGQLRDEAVEVLLTRLAQAPKHLGGLCLATSRVPVKELEGLQRSTAPEWKLEDLPDPAGAALLHSLGVTRAGAAAILPDDAELRAASREVGGHALTLRILGNFLAKAHHGDVRKRDQVKLAQADARYKIKLQDRTSSYGHAFQAMAAYEKWLAENGVEGERQLALLRLLSLFDRPADPGCLAALRQPPAIAGLTESLAGLGEADWNFLVSELEAAGLVKASAYAPKPIKGYDLARLHHDLAQPSDYLFHGPRFGEPDRFVPPTGVNDGSVLEAHPLLREYFGQQLYADNPGAWQEGHRRVYVKLIDSVPFYPEGTEGLAPLYQAVAHGCHAGLHKIVRFTVYEFRIQRYQECYSTAKLGLFGTDLASAAWFFESPWTRPRPEFSQAERAWLFATAATNLRALGRLSEALQPMRSAVKEYADQQDWEKAATNADNLSGLELVLGQLGEAVGDAELAIDYAERSGEWSPQMMSRTTLADALHQTGRRTEALECFSKAEALLTGKELMPLLYSRAGFRYCDLLLAETERAAWRKFLGPPCDNTLDPALLATCDQVEWRALQSLVKVKGVFGPLASGLDYLTFARIALYRPILEVASDRSDRDLEDRQNALALCVFTGAAPDSLEAPYIDTAMERLRIANQQEYLPSGLLTCAWLCCLQGNPDAARTDLEEARQIAERGSMRLHLADINLCRARLFHDREALAAAHCLIEECGYGRRREELEDVEAAANAW